MLRTLAFFGCAATVAATAHFKETFDASYADRWSQSAAPADDKPLGKMEYTAGSYYGGAEDEAKGIRTSEDAKHYWYSAKAEAFDNKGKDLVLSYTVKQTGDLDCGGSYIKLMPKDFDPAKFTNDSPYGIMFGPDQCGSTKRIHAIFTYKGKNLLKTSDISLDIYDKYSHTYTLVVKTDRTYEVFVDKESKAKGALADDWDFLKPKEVVDPADTKPADWVESKQMDDPEDKKPEGYDDIPEKVADPEAKKPDDWDDEDDGEWEAPQITNKDFKGKWSAKQIDNPAYKGPWVQKKIANPEFADDATMHEMEFGGVAFELWQVKAGTLFDNIYVGDSQEEAFALAPSAETLAAEKKMKEDADKVEADKKAAEDKVAADAKAAEDKAKADAEPKKEETKDDL